MRRTLLIVPAMFLVATAGFAAFQAESKLKSGPQAGESMAGAFHFLNVNGTFAGSPHCLVCEYGLEPAVVVFVRELPDQDKAGKAVSSLLKKLDEAVGKHQKARLHCFAVFLSDDVQNEEKRKKLVQALEGLVSTSDLKNVILCVGPAAGPEKYNLSKDAEVTVLVYRNHKVDSNFAFGADKFTEKDVDAVLAAVTNMIRTKN